MSADQSQAVVKLMALAYKHSQLYYDWHNDAVGYTLFESARDELRAAITAALREQYVTGMERAPVPDECAAFETWTREAYSATDLDLKKDQGRYVWNEERRLWQCWQAARAGIAASAGQAATLPDKMVLVPVDVLTRAEFVMRVEGWREDWQAGDGSKRADAYAAVLSQLAARDEAAK